MTAPASRKRFRLFVNRMLPLKYFPAGRNTVPPPAAAQAAIVRLIAGLSSVLPSPVAPNERTLKCFCDDADGAAVAWGERDREAQDVQNIKLPKTMLRQSERKRR